MMSDLHSSINSNSTLSLDSESLHSVDVINPLDSIFNNCLNALSPDASKTKSTPMPGLFKILSLLDKSVNLENRGVTNDDSISRLLSSLPVPVPSSSNPFSSIEKEPSSCLNPLKIDSSIFYDSSEKGDTLSSWNLKEGKLEPKEKPLESSQISKHIVEPMSGDCLSLDPQFQNLPRDIVHQVYYSFGSTNISVRDSDNNEDFQESSDQTPPTSGRNSSPNSDYEAEDELSENPEKKTKAKQTSAKCGDSSSTTNSPSGDDKTNANNSSSKEDVALPAEIPDFLEEEEELFAQEHIALCLRQLVGNNLTLPPATPSQTEKFSDDFSNMFY